MDAAGLHTPEAPELNTRIRATSVYVRRKPISCEKCGRIQTEEGGRAVVTRAIAKGTAYLRCKACKHMWALPVQDV